MAYGKSPFIMDGLKKQTTASLPHGGGNGYYQMPVMGQFKILPAIAGHTQKANLTVPKEYKGSMK